MNEMQDARPEMQGLHPGHFLVTEESCAKLCSLSDMRRARNFTNLVCELFFQKVPNFSSNNLLSKSKLMYLWVKLIKGNIFFSNYELAFKVLNWGLWPF